MEKTSHSGDFWSHKSFSCIERTRLISDNPRRRILGSLIRKTTKITETAKMRKWNGLLNMRHHINSSVEDSVGVNLFRKANYMLWQTIFLTRQFLWCKLVMWHQIAFYRCKMHHQRCYMNTPINERTLDLFEFPLSNTSISAYFFCSWNLERHFHRKSISFPTGYPLRNRVSSTKNDEKSRIQSCIYCISLMYFKIYFINILKIPALLRYEGISANIMNLYADFSYTSL